MCVNQKPLPNQGYLLEILRYDPKTGLLFWRRRPMSHFPSKRAWAVWNSRFSNGPAFRTKTKGYRAGKVDGVNYFAHRIVWKMVHGFDPLVIDHKNHDRSDNRVENLRNGTQKENCAFLKRGAA